MTFSVAKKRPFRLLGLYRSSGKHAAPRVVVRAVPREETAGTARRPAHAVTMPRLTGSHANDRKAA